MGGQLEHVVLFAEPQQLGPQHPFAFEPEAVAHLLVDPGGDRRLLGFGRQRREVLDRQGEGRRGVQLEAQAGLGVEVAGAQHLVAGDQGAERLFERRGVERAAQLDRQRDVVGGRVRLELVEEIEAPLAERRRSAGGRP